MTAAMATTRYGLDVKHASSQQSMDREQVIALIGSSVDYSRQRCRVLRSRDCRFDADAVRGEFEEWLNPSRDCLPLMTRPLPRNG